MEEKDRLRVVLMRLLEEDRYSLEEYGHWMDVAEKAGLGDVRDLIGEAEKSTRSAMRATSAALDLISR